MAESTKDYRPKSKHKPVWRRKLAQFTWASGVTAAVEKDIEVNGIMRVIVGVANNSTNAITYTTAIYDEDDYTLYSKADWAENATEVVTLTADTEIFIPSGATLKITPSGDPGASGGTFDVTLIGR